MIIDGVDIADLGAIVQTRGNSRSRTDIQHIMQQIPGAWQGVYVGRNGAAPKLLSCSGFITTASISALRTAMDELQWRCDPTVERTVSWSDITDREWLGYSSGVTFTGFRPEWVQPHVQFNVAFLCVDPRARDTSLTSTQTSGSLPLTREINVGTAPHPMIITITGDSGNLTNPTVTYRDYSNADVYINGILQSFTITDVLDASETVRINTETGVVEKDSGGGYVNAGGTFSGTLLKAYPADGRAQGGTYPPTTVDVQLTGGGGESSDLFKVEYYRRYW